MAHQDNPEFFKGRGAQVNTDNKFLKRKYVLDHIEGLDEPLLENSATQLFEETPKKIVSESNSPDLSNMYSINPYQGCEHGCIYCYARNTHEYYGFSAGLDFERKIIVKRNAPELLEKYFNKAQLSAGGHPAIRQYRLLPTHRAPLKNYPGIAGGVFDSIKTR
jgi:hypothetical protein